MGLRAFPDAILDERIRAAAFEHVRQLATQGPHLTSREIDAGFVFEGEKVALVNANRGIYKPRQMRRLLSIRTIFPKPGGRVWYDDQRQVHRQLYQSDDFVDYSFQGRNPEAFDNQWLRDAMRELIPIIYFVGIAPQRFLAVVPSYIADWDAQSLKVKVGFGDPADFVDGRYIDNPAARRYAIRTTQQRLHQATFRQSVIAAYDNRCALSGLPEPRLLDAAHIIADKDELLGQPVVANGLPLTKIHHAAFDAHLLGVDADYRIHVSPQLLDQRDGPMLEALKSLHGNSIRLAIRECDRPDRDRLAARFETFQSRV